MVRWLPLTFALVAALIPGTLSWSAEEPAPPAAPAAKSDAAADSLYLDRLKEIRLLEIRNLRAKDEKEFQQGRQALLALKDESYVGPMVHVLYGENARYRGLLLEALGEFAKRNSKVAKAYLQELAVGDANQGHRRRAVGSLKGWSGDPPTDRLMVHLALDEVPALRDRAATALAALDERHAVWLMVERLVTEETRVTGAEIRDAQVTMDVRAQSCGVPTFRHAVVQAAVPGLGIASATIDLPEVQVIDVATTLGMTDRNVQPTVQRVQVQHPEILAALKSLTGKDFGYDRAAWLRYLKSPEAATTIPAWTPVRLKTE